MAYLYKGGRKYRRLNVTFDPYKSTETENIYYQYGFLDDGTFPCRLLAEV